MSRSTGPILAVGAITVFNDTVIHGLKFENEARIIVGTAIAAGGLTLLEKVSEPLAVGLAWVALVTMLLVRVNPNVPSPVESFNAWYNETSATPSYGRKL